MAKTAARKKPALQNNIHACGIDEAGRGPLAGPVIAACVYIPEEKQGLSFWAEIRDSKKLSAKKRDDLFLHINEHALCGIGQADVAEIDELNIHHATLLAMKRAYFAMTSSRRKPGSSSVHQEDPGLRRDDVTILIDGKFTPPGLPVAATPVIGGDGLHLPIAAASILAKVTRDRIMAALHEKYPAYGWAKNAGYGTPEHLEALKIHGVTIHHRRSFSPVNQRIPD